MEPAGIINVSIVGQPAVVRLIAPAGVQGAPSRVGKSWLRSTTSGPNLDETALIVRTSNTEPHKFEANTFGTLSELESVIRFRVDSALWWSLTMTQKIQVLVQAYNDVNMLPWSQVGGRSQSRDYGWNDLFGGAGTFEPPIYDAEFKTRVKRAQAAQIMFILAGTQVRDMAREGIVMTRQLTGSEIEFSGYRGPCGGEVWEILGSYVDRHPRMKRLA